MLIIEDGLTGTRLRGSLKSKAPWEPAQPGAESKPVQRHSGDRGDRIMGLFNGIIILSTPPT